VTPRFGKKRAASEWITWQLRSLTPLLFSYRFRVGEYRVIFDLEGDDIVVLRVGHGRQIYRG
jgi:mRNA interferase RelE/StbE